MNAVMMTVKQSPAVGQPDHQVLSDTISTPATDSLVETWGALSRSIARRVKLALIDRSLRQKDLARLIGFRPQQMSRVLSGKANLTIKTIAKMELALGIRLIQVVSEESRWNVYE